MKNYLNKRILLKLACVAGIFFVGLAEATEYRYLFGLANQSSDNITQRPGGESGSATTGSLELSLASTESIDFTYDLGLRLNRINYSVSGLESEDTKSFEGNVNYQPRSANFSVLGLGSITQVPVNRFQTQQVNNLREERAVALMPAYFVRLNTLDRITFTGMKVKFDSETSNQAPAQLDNSRDVNEFAAELQRQINPTNFISLVAKKSTTDFTADSQQGVIDYDKQEYYLKWRSDGSTNRILAELGRSKLTDQQGRELDADLHLFNIFRQVNRNQTIEYRFTNGIQGAVSTNLATDRIVINQRNEVIPSAQLAREHSLSYAYTALFLRTALSVNQREISQVFTPNKELQKGARLAFSYGLSRLLGTPLDSRVELVFDKNESEFDSAQTQITDTQLTQVSLIYRHMYSQTLSMFIELQSRRSKELSADLSIGRNDSDSIFLGFTYSDFGRF
ncbi:hypothetical protein ACUR5C_01680 [Aliikangiella sp. IMCC44653]